MISPQLMNDYMNYKKTTLNDIRLRKAEVLCEMRRVRTEVNADVCALCHPFRGSGRLASVSAFRNVVSVARNALLAYRVASSVVSFFRRRKH